MPEFQLLPGARGMDFDGGGSVYADKRGRVKVSEEAAQLIRGSAAYRRYDAMVEVAPGRFHASKNDFTCQCGFAPWAWQNTCPKCGAKLERA